MFKKICAKGKVKKLLHDRRHLSSVLVMWHVCASCSVPHCLACVLIKSCDMCHTLSSSYIVCQAKQRKTEQRHSRIKHSIGALQQYVKKVIMGIFFLKYYNALEWESRFRLNTEWIWDTVRYMEWYSNVSCLSELPAKGMLYVILSVIKCKISENQ